MYKLDLFERTIPIFKMLQAPWEKSMSTMASRSFQRSTVGKEERKWNSESLTEKSVH